MKKIFTISLFLLSLTTAFSQSVGVGTTTPNASAKLDVSSNTQGFLMPRMSTVQRRAIVNAAPGLMVFDLDKNTLYMYDGGNWNPLSFVGENTLSPTPRFPSDATSNKRFGKSVSISGNYAIVGAPGDTSGGGTSKGAAYVFFKSNNSWVQQAKLQAADGVAYDGFGSAVSIDGDYLVVGACFATVAGHYQQGAAYIFNRTGTSWLQQAKLSASDGVENDNFSTALAISGDNVIISAYLATVGSNTGQGAVYAFKRSGTSWPFQNKLVAADGMANNFFGMSVAVSGSYAVIGASNATIGADNNNGAAYVFVQGGGTWTFQTKLNGNAGGSYNFGFSVSISGDLIAVGAPYMQIGNNNDAGEVYVYKRSGSTWPQEATIFSNDNSSGNMFGYAVAISGEYLLAGVYGKNIAQLYKKGAYNDYNLLRQIDEPGPGVLSYYSAILSIDGYNCLLGDPSKTGNDVYSGGVFFLNFQ